MTNTFKPVVQGNEYEMLAKQEKLIHLVVIFKWPATVAIL